MPELRADPVVERWVIVATERRRRPVDFKEKGDQPSDPATCPFCEGHEDKTPPEVFAFRAPGTKANTPGWSVRVIPNKFPALAIEGGMDRRGIGLFDMMNGIGAHEVVVEGIDHYKMLADADISQIELVLRALKERIIDLRKDTRFRYILVFKNHGQAAGTSLYHSHCQLIATPVTPIYVREKLMGAKQYYTRKERCIFCDITMQELSMGERIVCENEDFVVMSPYASRFPFELMLIPRYHSFEFSETPDDKLAKLAQILKETLQRLKITLNDPPFNFVLHTAPNIIPRPGHPEYWGSIRYDFHWHLEIIPRVTHVAGFEWGTGFYINPTPPEEATKYLREVVLT